MVDFPVGYRAKGDRRTIFMNAEAGTNATAQGTDVIIPVLAPIYVHSIHVSVAVKIPTPGVPAALTDWDVLFTISWIKLPQASAAQGATQFYPFFPADGNFGAQTAVGNANSGGGAGSGNFAATPLSRDILWALIMKGSANASGPIGGPYISEGTVFPEGLIPEGAMLVIHGDEVVRAVMSLDFEVVITMTYTPLEKIGTREMRA